MPETVGDDGTFNAWVPLFAGVHVYKAAEPVCAALIEAGGLLARGRLIHSYPHSWRSKAPLIFRATPQWFIRMDGAVRIREKALAAIAETHFVPEKGRTRLASMIAAKPDWCISRQRAWGVPIAVFVERKTGQPLRDPEVVARIVAAFREEGADAWFASPPERFLGPGRDPAEYEQVRDILDVWFESGSTHAFTLEDRHLPWPADLYLEGSDQHRGWFNSSLLEAVGTRGRAPFRAVLTHGFVLDEQGRKMSKSLGNVIAPQEVWDKYGSDILRLWVMMSDTADDLRIGPDILKQQAELYRRLRNTLRWLLGSLHGFAAAEHLPEAEMPELERWVLHGLAELDARVRHGVRTFDWTGVYPAIHSFCAVDLSAFYFDIRKDALYCDRPDSVRRRAARTVLDHLHRCLSTWLAPVLVFTAEEAWTARFGEQVSVHLQDFPDVPPRWRDEALAAKWQAVRARRAAVTAALEEMRRAGTIGAALQARAALRFAPEEDRLLSDDEWAEVLLVSAVAVGTAAPGEPGGVEVAVAEGQKCARCWRVLPEVGTVAHHPALCRRCADAVELRPGVPGVSAPQDTGAAGAPGAGAAEDEPDPAVQRARARRILGIMAAILVFGLDQMSKSWTIYSLHLPELGTLPLLPGLNFTWVENRGITFGLLNGVSGLGPMLLTGMALTGVALAVVAALAVWMWRAERLAVAIALGVIAGGALGNVRDRLRFGFVIDFVHLHAWGWSWYVFNLADAAIVCGVAALVLEGALGRPARGTGGGRLAGAPDGG